MARWDKRRRLLLRWTLASTAILLVTMTWSLASRNAGDEAVLPGESVEGLTSVLERTLNGELVPIRFEDVTARSGIAFHHFPADRASLLPEDMGSGVACGDYDDDGYCDLFFVNFSGSILPGSPTKGPAGGARLYRNQGGGHFEDVTEQTGVGFAGYGMGASWGDFDNDGDLDLYITAFGKNVLYRHDGDGTFTDVTLSAGVQDPRFSAGCAWGDYDRDGDLDLYVCNYVHFVFREQDRRAVKEQYNTEQPYTLNPSAYAPQPNALFRNNGDGTFTDVAEAAGVADPTGRGLSASWVDLNNDGWIDLYVANDVSNNGVFLNQGDGHFADIGAASLAADYRGAMGIAIGDFDNDLDEDVFLTHWIAQENALFVNMTHDTKLGPDLSGRLWFMDQADIFGFGQVSLDMVGWATGFCDFDNDGRRDLWLINGSTLERVDNHGRLEPQRPFLFWNRGERGFVDVSRQVSAAFRKPFVGRGGAQVDFDRDGLVDWIVMVHGKGPLVLHNTSTATGHWLGIALRQNRANTYALGARVYVTAGGITQMEELVGGASYLSQNEATLHFGMGQTNRVASLRIVWPDGQEERHTNLAVDRHVSFRHEPRYGPVAPPKLPDVSENTN